ncbi:MAG: hypothetical protein LBH55_02880 [Mycoplasmataceae bacterium]|jgi:hypothetical protein|nr:hypothetical protein [Mycoplasmataceae bacterium]
MNEKAKSNFHTIKIRIEDKEILQNYCQKLNINYSDLIHEAISFYTQNKLYEEFSQSPASALMKTEFYMQNKSIESLKIGIDAILNNMEAKFNEQKILNEKMIVQLKEQQDLIKKKKGEEK